MKFLVAATILLSGYASASPELSLTLKDGSFGSLSEAGSPAIKFHGTSGGIEYGGSAELGTDGIPKSIWGQTTTTASGWNLKSRAELSHGLYDFDGEDSGAYVTVEGTNDDEDAFVWASGSMSADGGFKPLTAGVKKVLEGDNGKFMIAPRFSFESHEAKVVVGFEKDDTKAYATLSQDEKNVLVEHKVNDSNSASFKAGSAGFISASISNESDVGTTKLTYTGSSVDVEIENDGWKGIGKIPRDGTEPTVHFSKTVAFTAPK